MKRVLAIISPFIVLFFATCCASLLAYTITQIFGDAVSFRTLFKRSTQFFLVCSIFPLMYLLKLSRRDIGFSSRTEIFKQLQQGFGIGFITLFPVLVSLYLLDVHVIDAPLARELPGQLTDVFESDTVRFVTLALPVLVTTNV